MSRYEFTEGTSRKFWDVSLRGKQLIVRWGRIDTQGQSKVFEFPTAAAARQKQSTLIREKTGKGYRPAKSTTAKSTTAAPKPGQAHSTRRIAKVAPAKAAPGRARPPSSERE